MKRRFVLFLFTAIMATALLTACQGSPAQSSEDQTATEQEVEADSSGEGQTDATEDTGMEAKDESAAGSEGGVEVADASAQEGPADGESVAAPLSEVYLKITSLVDLKSPVEMPAKFLSQTYGVDTGILEDFILVISEDATSAETIAILKAKDAAVAEACAKALEVLIEEKSMEMENYLPDQYKLVKDSKVNVKGNVAYLVISENAKDILAIIEENI